MGIIVVLLVIAGVMVFVGLRARSSPEREESEAPDAPAKPEADPKNLTPDDTRYFVHRSPIVLSLDAHVKGVAVTRPAHEALLEHTGFDVLSVLERDGGALIPVTTALVEDSEPTSEVFVQFLDKADAELAALPFTWKAQPGGFFLSEANDLRAAARLLRIDAFTHLPFPRSRMLVMIPDQHTLLAADGGNAAALAALLDEALARYDGEHWFSLDPLTWEDDAWCQDLPVSMPDALRKRFVEAFVGGVLRDFRDATAQTTFPPARLSRVGVTIAVQWREHTTVVTPNFYGSRAWLLLAEKSFEDVRAISLRAQRCAAFVSRVQREGHVAFPVLDGRRFPPSAVLDVLEKIDEAEEGEPIELPLTQTLAEMKKFGAVVLPAIDDEPIEVWLGDGRRIVFHEHEHEQELVAALEPAVRAWSALLIARRDDDLDGALLAKALVDSMAIAALANEGKHREALVRLEGLAASLPELPAQLLEFGVSTALELKDPSLIGTWCRRGLAEQPFNRAWHAALVANQVQQAAEKKPQTTTTVDESGPRAALMPVLRPPGHSERQHARYREAFAETGAPEGKLLIQEPLRWPLARGLELELVYDQGASMQPLNMLDAAGSLAEELKDIALANLEAASGGPMPLKDGAWIADWTDGFAASRLLLDWEEIDWLHDEARPTDVIAFTPVYDSFLVAPANDARALERAVTEAEALVEKSTLGWRELLTALPWRFDGTAWMPHEFPAHLPIAQRVAKLEARLLEKRKA